MFQKGLFIFRRDLRLVDNRALYRAQEMCREIVPLFIFTPEQTTYNARKSPRAIAFMLQCLEDLSNQIEQRGGKLFLFYGKNREILKQIFDATPIPSLFFNQDYTPYAKERDKEIEDLCRERGVSLETETDYTLHAPGQVVKKDSEPYTVFTPFYKKVLPWPISSMKKETSFSFSKELPCIKGIITLEEARTKWATSSLSLRGGREQAFIRLENKPLFKEYAAKKDQLAYSTTLLSPYLKFGSLSIREAYFAIEKVLGRDSSLIRQLYWREFYLHILNAFPFVLEKSMKENCRNISWRSSQFYFDAWKEGETGFPIVDAAMRELNERGFITNRARLIVASFLVKTLLIDWKVGEKYFAEKLIDYDPASNNGNWQWVAGTGTDSQPYFRIFNPWLQSAKFDPDASYIKTWIPELKDISPSDLHNWHTSWIKYKHIYRKPIVDYAKQKEACLTMYKEAFG